MRKLPFLSSPLAQDRWIPPLEFGLAQGFVLLKGRNLSVSFDFLGISQKMGIVKETKRSKTLLTAFLQPLASVDERNH